jgi:hypothetical protein
VSRSLLTGEAKAWACLTANALMLPGLGSVMAGQWLAGLVQAAVSLVGFAMTAFWIFKWLAQMLAEGALPEENLGFGPFLGYGASGIALFGIAWIWSVAASALKLRAARKAAGPAR